MSTTLLTERPTPSTIAGNVASRSKYVCRQPPNPTEVLKRKQQVHPLDDSEVKDFTTAFGNAVVKVAKRHRWSPTTKQQARLYIRSLVEGDASVPQNLRGKPLEAIQLRFAYTCAKRGVVTGQLPGTLQDWFDDYKLSAHRRIESSRETGQ